VSLEAAVESLWDRYSCDSCGPLRLARSPSEKPLSHCPFCTTREGGGRELVYRGCLTSERRRRQLQPIAARVEVAARMASTSDLNQAPARIQLRRALVQVIAMIDQGQG
jgi:hypothetical protein